jgi:hypothetical protein
MNRKLIAVPVIAAGLGLAACSSSGTPSHPVSTHRTTPPVSSASSLPATVAAGGSPVGTWNVAYSSAPSSTLGQYTITSGSSIYYITTKTALRLPVGNCSVPAGEDEGSFSAANGAGTFSGTEKVWEPGTCAYAYMSAFTATLSSGSNSMTLQIANATPTGFTLTRTGSAPSAAPSTTAPAPSATECLVPDITSSEATAATAVVDMQNAGFRSTVVQKAYPNGSFPAGYFWGTSPAETSRAACGSTVTLYEQP